MVSACSPGSQDSQTEVWNTNYVVSMFWKQSDLLFSTLLYFNLLYPSAPFRCRFPCVKHEEQVEFLQMVSENLRPLGKARGRP